MKKVFLASDHAGFELKRILADCLRAQKYEVEDCGPAVLDVQDDYPDYIAPMAKKVLKKLSQ